MAISLEVGKVLVQHERRWNNVSFVYRWYICIEVMGSFVG